MSRRSKPPSATGRRIPNYRPLLDSRPFFIRDDLRALRRLRHGRPRTTAWVEQSIGRLLAPYREHSAQHALEGPRATGGGLRKRRKAPENRGLLAGA